MKKPRQKISASLFWGGGGATLLHRVKYYGIYTLSDEGDLAVRPHLKYLQQTRKKKFRLTARDLFDALSSTSICCRTNNFILKTLMEYEGSECEGDTYQFLCKFGN